MMGGETGVIISSLSKLVMEEKKYEKKDGVVDLDSALPALNKAFLDNKLISEVDSSFGKGISLCGVFDGHMGKVAAEFVQARFVWTLMTQPTFKTGEYKKAIESATVTVHCLLRECSSYMPEKLDMSNSPSGCTFSIALSDAKVTHFALLGDSPIYCMRRQKDESGFIDDRSDTAFSEVLPMQLWSGENRQRLTGSNFPIIANEKFFILPFTKEHSQLQGKRLRPGFVGVEPAGGIGDTIYDAAIFNALLTVFDRYKKKTFMEHLIMTARSHKLNAKLAGLGLARFVFKSPVLWSTFYKHMRDYLRSLDEYKNGLDRHFFLDPLAGADPQQAEFCKWYLGASEEQARKIHLDPNVELVQRTPAVCTLPNEEMMFYCICSDGVISNPARNKFHASNISIITKETSSPTLCAQKVTEHFSTHPDDDHDDQSFVIASF